MQPIKIAHATIDNILQVQPAAVMGTPAAQVVQGCMQDLHGNAASVCMCLSCGQLYTVASTRGYKYLKPVASATSGGYYISNHDRAMAIHGKLLW